MTFCLAVDARKSKFNHKKEAFQVADMVPTYTYTYTYTHTHVCWLHLHVLGKSLVELAKSEQRNCQLRDIWLRVKSTYTCVMFGRLCCLAIAVVGKLLVAIYAPVFVTETISPTGKGRRSSFQIEDEKCRSE